VTGEVALDEVTADVV